MIINGIADMRRFCPAIIIQDDRDTFDDAIAVAEDTVEHEILGEDLYTALEGLKEQTPLRVKAARAIALQAFVTKMSSIDIVLHDTGFGVENSEAFQAASRARVEALKENTRRERDAAFDVLIRTLLESEDHADWRTTPQYNRITAGLVALLREFRAFAIVTPESEPRMPQDFDAFLEIRPKMADALQGMIAPRTGAAFVAAMQDALRSQSLTPQWQQALFLMKWVVVNNALGNEAQAEFYLARLLALLAADPESFPQYVVPEAASAEKKNRAVMNFL